MKIDCARPSIIIWTEEEVLREIISCILGDEGFNTLNVHDKHELFMLLEEHSLSIVILDDGLPQILGFEVYEVIKRIDRFKDAKVILVSSIHQSASSADECIEKDHIQEDLLSKIRTFIPNDLVLSESERQMHEEARRFARIIVSDVVLYNKDKADRGAREGTFYELLKDEIEEGERFYSNRVPSTILTTTHYFDEAIHKFIRTSLKV